MRTIERIIAAAMIVSSDGKILFGLKDPTKGGTYSDGCWYMPGGGVEDGESLGQALVREVKEETGIDISKLNTKLIDSSDYGTSERTLPSGERVVANMKFYNYRVTLPQKAAEVLVKSVDGEFIEFKWATLEDLKSLKLTPPSSRLLARLGVL